MSAPALLGTAATPALPHLLLPKEHGFVPQLAGLILCAARKGKFATNYVSRSNALGMPMNSSCKLLLFKYLLTDRARTCGLTVSLLCHDMPEQAASPALALNWHRCSGVQASLWGCHTRHHLFIPVHEMAQLLAAVRAIHQRPAAGGNLSARLEVRSWGWSKSTWRIWACLVRPQLQRWS